jgi:hypothetical protein
LRLETDIPQKMAIEPCKLAGGEDLPALLPMAGEESPYFTCEQAREISGRRDRFRSISSRFGINSLVELPGRMSCAGIPIDPADKLYDDRSGKVLRLAGLGVATMVESLVSRLCLLCSFIGDQAKPRPS